LNKDILSTLLSSKTSFGLFTHKREAHQTIEAIITFIRKSEKKLPLDITKSSELHPHHPK
jgi:hypothetical protein